MTHQLRFVLLAMAGVGLVVSGCGGTGDAEALMAPSSSTVSSGSDASVDKSPSPDAPDESSTPPPEDASVEADSQPDVQTPQPNNTITLPCPKWDDKQTQCTFPSDACCVSFKNTKYGRCAHPDDPGMLGCDTPVLCRTSDDCPAPKRCCGKLDKIELGWWEGIRYTSVACQDTCGDDEHVIFCNPSRGDSDCPDGTHCVPSQILPKGYFVCARH